MSSEMASKVKDVLIKNNSYGPDLLNEIMKCVHGGKGQFVSSRINVMGSSPFAQVLKLSLVLTALFNEGLIGDMSDTPSGDHIETIIKAIKENQNAIKEYGSIGFEPVAL